MVLVRKDFWVYEDHQQVKCSSIPSTHRAFKSCWGWPTGAEEFHLSGAHACLFAEMSCFIPAVLASHPGGAPVNARAGPHVNSKLSGYPAPGKLEEPMGGAQVLKVLQQSCV